LPAVRLKHETEQHPKRPSLPARHPAAFRRFRIEAPPSLSPCTFSVVSPLMVVGVLIYPGTCRSESFRTEDRSVEPASSFQERGKRGAKRIEENQQGVATEPMGGRGGNCDFTFHNRIVCARAKEGAGRGRCQTAYAAPKRVAAAASACKRPSSLRYCSFFSLLKRGGWTGSFPGTQKIEFSSRSRSMSKFGF
jgi:hypothetical protein